MESFLEFKQKYGSPRITAELNARGHKVSRLTVARYMRELGLRSKLAKRFKVIADSKQNYLIVDNLLNRNLKQSQPAKACVSDITYKVVKEGFIYLIIVVDLYHRKLIGWSLSRSMCIQYTALPDFLWLVKIVLSKQTQFATLIKESNHVFACILEPSKEEEL